MRAYPFVALAIVAALAACESAPKIRANTDQTANLSSYKTYTFAPHPGTDRGGVATPMTSYFKEAIRREMDARGYQFVESGDADLLVNFNANARENVDVRSTPGTSMGYYGYRGGMYGGAMLSSPEVETVRYRVGTANVDIVDTRRKQIIWEGIAEATLTDKMMDDPRAAISKVITDMFTKFTGHAAA